MTAIQIILSAILIVGVLVYFRRLRTRLVDRAVIFFMGLAGLVMVLRPDWANQLAQFLGVGRGADLLTYLGLSALAFLWLSLYTRQRRLEETLTDLARQLAILGAEAPEDEQGS